MPRSSANMNAVSPPSKTRAASSTSSSTSRSNSRKLIDLEASFLFPWAVSLEYTGWTGWIAMIIFLGILAVGLAYEWKMGALDWE